MLPDCVAAARHDVRFGYQVDGSSESAGAFDGAEIDAGPSFLSRVSPLLLDVVFVPSSGPAAHGVRSRWNEAGTWPEVGS